MFVIELNDFIGEHLTFWCEKYELIEIVGVKVGFYLMNLTKNKLGLCRMFGELYP